MPIQVISLLILALQALPSSLLAASLETPARADEDVAESKSKLCFDFSKKLIPLPKKPAILSDATLPRVSSKSGRMSANMFWGAARGQVGRPIQELIQEIAAHETMKSGRVTNMAVIPQETQDFLIRQQIEYTVIPFMFVKIKWTEDWAFNLMQGTKEDPKEVQIFYQKTEGTSHIKHLCGTIVLNRLDPKVTDVFIYEEAQATSRSEEDTVKGLIGTIRTFRYGRQ
jgi:hypothetical protein